MSANRAIRPEPDQRLLVLLALGLALCLGPLLSRSFSPHHEQVPPAAPAYLWLTGIHAPEGLYRLAPDSRPSETALGSGFDGLPTASEKTRVAAAPRYGAFKLQKGGTPVPIKPPARLAPFFFAPIAVNHADRELLMTLPGIGPRLAEAIIGLRQQKRKLQRMDELLEVTGIGKGKIAKLTGRVSFD